MIEELLSEVELLEKQCGKHFFTIGDSKFFYWPSESTDDAVKVINLLAELWGENTLDLKRMSLIDKRLSALALRIAEDSEKGPKVCILCYEKSGGRSSIRYSV